MRKDWGGRRGRGGRRLSILSLVPELLHFPFWKCSTVTANVLLESKLYLLLIPADSWAYSSELSVLSRKKPYYNEDPIRATTKYMISWFSSDDLYVTIIPLLPRAQY